MFTFDMLWVFLLLPLPLAIYFLVAPDKQTAESGGILVPFYQQATSYTETQNPKKHHLLQTLFLGSIWCLLVIAAARPQWLGPPQALANTGRDLLLAVDISTSMEQTDMQIDQRPASRIAAVKHVVSEFITQRKGDRIGLVLFGSNAYLQTPLTFDTQSVQTFLEEAQLGFAGGKTAIGDAIGLSVKRLQELPNKEQNSKVIILLTDGANTAGAVEPIQAAKLAQQTNIKIYTVGIGADEMVIRSFFGNRRINPSASLDENTLKTIASSTNGLYFRARNTDELNNIYQELDELEPIEQDKQWLRPVNSLFIWPLGLAIILSLAFAAIKMSKKGANLWKS